MTKSLSLVCRDTLVVCALLFTLTRAEPSLAQPTIVSVNPADGATGVSTSAKIVFTFNESMFMGFAFLTNTSTGAFLPVSTTWNAPQNTVMTCTPIAPLPANSLITWDIMAFNSAFEPLTGTTNGSFTTGSGSGSGTGTGTNSITSFSVGKFYAYQQTSSGPPIVEPSAPYLFSASTLLASNRTASGITLTLPTGAISNLTQNLIAPEDYYLAGFSDTQTTFESEFPQGNYTFNVQATTSNQTLVVTCPLGMQQPNAPHLTNYTAAQAMDPAQTFTLGWDAFSGAGSTDAITVSLTFQGTNVFETGTPGAPGALVGIARTVKIPANTFQPNLTYDGQLSFYRLAFVTNNPLNVSVAFRASTTQFTVTTTGAAGGPLTLTNTTLLNGHLSFDILCASGQIFTVLSSPDLALPAAQWSVALTTNSSGTQVRFTDPNPAIGMGPAMFYRARSGP